MKLNTLIALTLASSLALAAPALPEDGTTTTPATATRQTAPTPLPEVNVTANGNDVRTVLHDLFSQTKQNFVIEPGIHFQLYLTLNKVDFDEALGIVCNIAKLKTEKVDGIYYVSLAPKPAHPTVATGEATANPAAKTPKRPTVTWRIVRGKLVTTRLAKTDIRTVFATLSSETGVPIKVDGSVPACKLDAFLVKTSLKYALDRITTAANLKYRIADQSSIIVYVPGAESHVALIAGE